MKQRLIDIARIILVLFLLINALAFSNIIIKQTFFRAYPVAKIPLAISAGLTYLYLDPLATLIDIDNPILIPLKSTRDSLLYLGMSLIPEDDAEREEWWLNLKGKEIVQWKFWRDSVDYIEKRTFVDEKTLDNKLALSDEYYGRLMNYISLDKYKDPKKSKNHYITAVALSKGYMNFRSTLISRRGHRDFEDFRAAGPFIRSKEEMEKIATTIDSLIGLRSRKIKNLAEYDRRNKWYQEYLFYLLSSYYILYSQDNLSCDSKHIYIYLDNLVALNNFYKRSLPVNQLDIEKDFETPYSKKIKELFQKNNCDIGNLEMAWKTQS